MVFPMYIYAKKMKNNDMLPWSTKLVKIRIRVLKVLKFEKSKRALFWCITSENN